jgi:CubicO group peptidase (beta-lactamase class C family)
VTLRAGSQCGSRSQVTKACPGGHTTAPAKSVSVDNMLDAAHWTIRLAELTRRAGVPGAVLGVWADGREVLAAAGVLNRATRVRVTAGSLFQLGSITKVWTATMVMQLVDEGLLSLGTTVAQVLPGIRIGARDIGGQVTVHHLLTHTSGLDGDVFTDTGRGDDCLQRYVSGLGRAASVFAPGQAYSYCNSGYVLLGRMIEMLDGRSWDESLRERLSGPLELDRTVTLPEQAILHRAAVGHRGDGAPVRVWGLPRSVGPAGLVTAAAHDLLMFARLHLEGGVAPDGKPLLSPASVRAMRQPQTAIPAFGSPGAAIGLGWRLNRWGDRVIIGHDGDTIGQSAYLRVDAEACVAACLLTNSAQSGSVYRDLFGEVFGALSGVSLPADPSPADGLAGADPADPGGSPGPAGLGLERHAGRYERTSRRFDVSVSGGQLRMVATTTGELAAITDPQPEELILYPADSSGANFVCRSHEDEPWTPLSFGRSADQSRYLFLGGRVTPRVG